MGYDAHVGEGGRYYFIGYCFNFGGDIMSDYCQKCIDRDSFAVMLEDCDAEELKILRRRVEDLLRKNPQELCKVGGFLAQRNSIKISDLI